MSLLCGRRLFGLAAITVASCASPPADLPSKPESTLRVQVVDFFGLRRVTPSDARAAMAVKEGDTIALDGAARPLAMDESERRLKKLPGVANAHLSLVCCEAGGGIVYVSIEEQGAP